MLAAFRGLLAAALACQLAGAAFAADALPLPTRPEQWINSPPLTAEMLAGKGAVFLFFEEQCPRCKSQWPAWLAAAKSFEGQPVLFIAVNSGSPRLGVEGYGREQRIPWPMIVDVDRSLEKAAGVGDVSLQNIWQAAILRADGRVERADPQNLKGAGERALAGAKWNIDPAGIPASLRPAWQALELGNFAAAAPLLKKSAGKDAKAAADQLKQFVATAIEQDLQAAKQAEQAGKKWQAYKLYNQLVERFAGHELPADVEPARRQLAQDAEVRAGVAAATALSAAKRQLASTSPSVRRRAKDVLEKILADAPGSDAAEEAKALLEQLR